MRLASFNVQSLRLRWPGGRPRLDGARDADVPADRGPAAEALDAQDRRLTAAVLAHARADVIALQEVFDQATLDHFHDHCLLATGAAPYPYRHCIPGNDGRGLDVAVISRLPLRSVVSHAQETPTSLGLEVEPEVDPDMPVFRRDCLRVEVGLITLFICHFKAPYPDASATWPVRRAEALALHRLIARQFPDPASGLWLILGDLNEPRQTAPARPAPAIAPVTAPFSIDLLERLPVAERWSWHEPFGPDLGSPDVMLASPALARRWPDACPQIIRHGLALEAAAYDGPRLAGVGRHRPHASDHAALMIELPGAEG
ncbi:MAG: endonuclease/exonuclease/phosphatase family protein [Paracoccaceae bacterium]|nr:endonuclease/exonuclease/phosphatase family protein [Paracoccaceae bacterium]